jgi:hypothetical protein
MIRARPMKPPIAVARRRFWSEPRPKLVNPWPMNAPTAIEAASPPAIEVSSWTGRKATGSTFRMLPAKSARVARGMQILCA